MPQTVVVIVYLQQILTIALGMDVTQLPSFQQSPKCSLVRLSLKAKAIEMFSCLLMVRNRRFDVIVVVNCVFSFFFFFFLVFSCR